MLSSNRLFSFYFLSSFNGLLSLLFYIDNYVDISHFIFFLILLESNSDKYIINTIFAV